MTDRDEDQQRPEWWEEVTETFSDAPHGSIDVRVDLVERGPVGGDVRVRRLRICVAKSDGRRLAIDVPFVAIPLLIRGLEKGFERMREIGPLEGRKAARNTRFRAKQGSAPNKGPSAR